MKKSQNFGTTFYVLLAVVALGALFTTLIPYYSGLAINIAGAIVFLAWYLVNRRAMKTDQENP